MLGAEEKRRDEDERAGWSPLYGHLEDNAAVDALVEMMENRPSDHPRISKSCADLKRFRVLQGASLPASNSQTTTQAGRASCSSSATKWLPLRLLEQVIPILENRV